MTDRRGAVKAKHAAYKWNRRARLARDAEVTELYGDKGHRMCGSKARYPNEGAAMDRAARYMALGAPKLRAYHCRMCDGWHLTSKELL